MSVYRPKGSPFYHYDFRCRGRRFCGSTGLSEKSQARKVEADRRRAAEIEAAEEPADGKPRTLGAVVARYWDEVGQHHVNAETTLTNLERLVGYFGAERHLSTIDDADVAALVAWRRAQHVKDREKLPLVSPATVNRSTTEMLQKLFNRAIKVWKVVILDPPTWKKHLLAEPQERVREVRAGEVASLDAVREDYRLLVYFARASGLRMASCMLRKSDVDLAGGKVYAIGKGGKQLAKPITTEIRAILMEAMANPTDFVFTYVARRAFDPDRVPGGLKRQAGAGRHAAGEHVPITMSGLKTIWRRAKAPGRAKAGAEVRPALPQDLRFHDMRHDFATKLLRTTGNLKLVQRALDHSKIETTTRYAHVLDEEVLAGMEAASALRSSSQFPNKLPKKPKAAS